MEQRSWGNRSSTLIRAGVLLKMSLQSPGDKSTAKHYDFNKKREKSVQQFKRFSLICLAKKKKERCHCMCETCN